jgi:predicted RNA-binding Zn-ribbon protein involved in translation (DUF1610 family)
MKKVSKKIKRCWQCKSILVKQKDGSERCPKNCGPEALGKLLSF